MRKSDWFLMAVVLLQLGGVFATVFWVLPKLAAEILKR
jgi:hypothetical protein